MAKSLLLSNPTSRNSENFSQSSFRFPDSIPEDLSSNPCETGKVSHFSNKLGLTLSSHLSASHLGLSLHELDSLSSTLTPELKNTLTDAFRIATIQAASESSNQSLHAEQPSRSESLCRELSESKQDQCPKSDSAVTPDDLIALMNNHEDVLLLDCRTFMAFNANHINGALNVCCSDRITKKRLVDGKVKVADIICGQEGKDAYRRLEKDAEIILYDESTVEMESLPETNTLNLLVKCLLKHGKHSKFLQGGLRAFQEGYSFMCSHPDAGVGVPLLYSPTSPEINCQIDTAVASEILPFLFIGNQRDAANRERLTELGVTHILNVTSHLPQHFENDGITYKRLPATDNGSQNLKQYFSEAINFIECARKENGKVLVHCQAGVSRSPTIVAAYLLATSYQSLTEAFTTIKDRRPIVAPNINFMGQLLEFEQRAVSRAGPCPPTESVHLG